jgi:hypothetical protein
VIDIVRDCLELYKSRARAAERFGTVLTPDAFQILAERFQPLT